jgi:putative spermidine/putrescine transport system permease protein
VRTKTISALIDEFSGIFPRLIVAFTVILIASPLILSLIISFSPRLAFPPTGFSLRWYLPLFSRHDFINSLGVSLFIGTAATSISLAIGIPASIVLVRERFRGREVLQMLFLSPLAIPAIVIGVSLIDLFVTLGVRDPLTRLLLGHVIITLPYVVRVISASLVGLDRRLEEAAMNLGADGFTTFQKITMPLMKSGIIAAIVFAFQTSINDISVSIFLVGTTFTTLPLVLLTWTYKYFDPSIAAVSGLLISSITILVVITEKLVGIDKLMGAFTGLTG